MTTHALPYRVVYATTADEFHPATDLEVTGLGDPSAVTTGGWATVAESGWPQELGLQFRCAVRVNTVRMLAHEFRVPTAVEILVGNPLLHARGPVCLRGQPRAQPQAPA